jgi:hypothetical protein
LKFLFCVRHARFARNFEVPLETLARRGHSIKVLLDRGDPRLPAPRDRVLARLAAENPEITVCGAPVRGRASWAETGRVLRTALDYARYLEPAYASVSRPRIRAGERVPPGFKALLSSRFGDRTLATIEAAERGLPTSPAVHDLLAAERPDLIAITPLVELGSPQLEYVRAARQLGIPTVLAVASWDSLTMKGGIRDQPDRVVVWNEAQRREAIELHGIDPKRVDAAGAVAYDHWLDWEPSSDRESFCRGIGLDPERPFILYAGSSAFIAPDEDRFLAEWTQKVLADPAMGGAAVLYRPHPTNAYELDGLAGPPDLVVHPRGGADPQDEESRRLYFDSLHHSAAVVGINTSVLLEATLVGRPVLTVVSRYRESQVGTKHFHYLLPEQGGPLRAAPDLDVHTKQLAAAIGAGAKPSEDFVRDFLRPDGPGTPASERFADTLERTAAEGPAGPMAESTRRVTFASRALAAAIRAALAVNAAVGTVSR